MKNQKLGLNPPKLTPEEKQELYEELDTLKKSIEFDLVAGYYLTTFTSPSELENTEVLANAILCGNVSNGQLIKLAERTPLLVASIINEQ